MKSILIILIIGMLVFRPINVFGQDDVDNQLNKQLDMLNLEEISTVINEAGINLSDGDFKQLIIQIIKGETDFSIKKIAESIFTSLFSEIYTNGGLIRNLLIIAIFSGILRNLTESFKNKGVGELGFCVSYIALVIVLYSSFHLASSVVSELINTIANFMHASIPLMTSIIIMSGNLSTALAFNPILYIAVNMMVFFIKDIIIPLILLVSAIQVVNSLTEKETLENLSESIKKGISFLLKSCVVIFISILSLQRITSPIINNLVTKTAKSAIGVVPVVGQILTGAVDTVMYFTQAVKSGVVIAVLIAALMILLVPILKLIALIIIYKLTAGLIQPICDERIVKCVGAIGAYTVLFLGAAVTVITMFIFFLLMILSL